MERQLDPAAGGGARRHAGRARRRAPGWRCRRPGWRADADGVRLALADGTPARAPTCWCSPAGCAPTPTSPRPPGWPSSAASLVDDRLRTDDPAISAIGDCAQHAAASTGLVAPAWAQARVVADVLTGADPRPATGPGRW